GLARDVAGGMQLTYGDETIDFTPPWPRRTMAELVAAEAGITPEQALDRDVLVRVAHERHVEIQGTMPTGLLLGTVFEALAEPPLVQPTFVTQFPVELSPLARRTDRAPRFVDRFELYVARHEIANAFSELNDPEDQRRRFEAQLEAR